MLKVLAVAPDVAGLPRLAAAEELARLGDVPGVQVINLLNVTRQRLMDRLVREQYDALVVIGHGGPGYVLISTASDAPGGERIDPQWLAEQLSNSGVGLAVIGVCQSSQRPAAAVLTQGFADVLPPAGIDTVTMDMDVADRAAVEYDVALFQSLANGSRLRRAHEAGVAAAAARGGGQQPRLTPRDGASPVRWLASDKAAATMDSAEYTYRLTNNERLLQGMDGKMDTLVEQLNEVKLQQRLQDEKLRAIGGKVDKLEATIGQLRTPVGYSREWLAGGAAVMLVILVLLVLVTWRLM